MVKYIECIHCVRYTLILIHYSASITVWIAWNQWLVSKLCVIVRLRNSSDLAGSGKLQNLNSSLKSAKFSPNSRRSRSSQIWTHSFFPCPRSGTREICFFASFQFDEFQSINIINIPLFALLWGWIHVYLYLGPSDIHHVHVIHLDLNNLRQFQVVRKHLVKVVWRALNFVLRRWLAMMEVMEVPGPNESPVEKVLMRKSWWESMYLMRKSWCEVLAHDQYNTMYI